MANERASGRALAGTRWMAAMGSRLAIRAWVGIALLGGASAPFVGPWVLGAIVVVAVPAIWVCFSRGHRYRGGERRWRFALGTGSALLLVAIAVRAGHGLVVGEAYVFLSPADVFSALGYIFVLLTAAEIVRLRRSGRELDLVLEAGIIAVAVGVVLWAPILASYAHDASIPLAERLVTTLYSFSVLAFLGVTVRLAAQGTRSRSYYLFCSAALLVFVTDFALTLETIDGSGTVADWRSALAVSVIPVNFVLAALAVLDPSVEKLTERSVGTTTSLSLGRGMLLLAALMVPSAMLTYGRAVDAEIDLETVVVGTALLAALVVGRLSVFARASDRSARQERALRAATRRFVDASSASELYEAVTQAVVELVGEPQMVRAACGPVELPMRKQRRPARNQLMLARAVSRGHLPFDDGALRVAGGASGEQGPAACAITRFFDSRGGSVAALEVISLSRPAPSTLDALESLTAEAALALENVSLLEDLRRQARSDPLTGLENRSRFIELLGAALEQRSTRELTVLFVDLDDFKRVNDDLGHVAGDELLVSAAGRLRSCLRDGDVAGRMGGDEFAALLVGASGSEVRAVADRILEQLRRPFSVHDQQLRVSASIGGAIVGCDLEPRDALRRADQAMYCAKSRGKDTYEIVHATSHLTDREVSIG